MGISDLDLDGAIQRMNVVLPNLKNHQAQFDLKTILDAIAAKDRTIAEQSAVIERMEKALQPFDLAHLSALCGDDPMRDITLHDLRFASEAYHAYPAPTEPKT